MSEFSPIAPTAFSSTARPQGPFNSSGVQKFNEKRPGDIYAHDSRARSRPAGPRPKGPPPLDSREKPIVRFVEQRHRPAAPAGGIEIQDQAIRGWIGDRAHDRVFVARG